MVTESASQITRLGQFFKDYKEYGPQTRTVLRGTSGKYRDALDDLETELVCITTMC